MNLTLIANKIWAWFWRDPYAALAQIVTALALIRELARHLEAYLVIWIPQTAHSRFWLFWARLMATLDQASLSAPRKPAAIRALYFWQQRRNALQQARSETQTAIVPVKRGNDETTT